MLAGQPDLDIVGDAGGEAEIAGRQQDDAISEAEPPQGLLGVSEEFPEFGAGLVRIADPDQFHLGELVQAHDAAGIAAV